MYIIPSGIFKFLNKCELPASPQYSHCPLEMLFLFLHLNLEAGGNIFSRGHGFWARTDLCLLSCVGLNPG